MGEAAEERGGHLRVAEGSLHEFFPRSVPTTTIVIGPSFLVDPGAILSDRAKRGGPSRNHKRIKRIWKREGLKVSQKQQRRARLCLDDGSCVRLRPERPKHVWSYDFVEDRTHDDRIYRTLVRRGAQPMAHSRLTINEFSKGGADDPG